MYGTESKLKIAPIRCVRQGTESLRPSHLSSPRTITHTLIVEGLVHGDCLAIAAQPASQSEWVTRAHAHTDTIQLVRSRQTLKIWTTLRRAPSFRPRFGCRFVWPLTEFRIIIIQSIMCQCGRWAKE